MKSKSKVKNRVKYIRGDGYKIINKDGTLSPETYYSKQGAIDMVNNVFHSHAFKP